MKMIAPNIARPITKPSEEATLNTLERNRFSGMIGSLARPSQKMNAISRTTPAIARPMIVPESHAYSLPPQVVTRISAADAGGQQRGAEVVDRVAVVRDVQVQPEDDDQRSATIPTGMFT